MTCLKKFYCEFVSHFEGFPFVAEFKDESTLKLSFGSNISCVFLRYLVSHCPDSCSYFVSSNFDDRKLYIIVYDD